MNPLWRKNRSSMNPEVYYVFTTTQGKDVQLYATIGHKVYQNPENNKMPEIPIKPCKTGHIMAF